jgi:hypothetical protein
LSPFTTAMSCSSCTSSITASSPVRASALRLNCPLRFSSACLFIPVTDADTTAATCRCPEGRPQRITAIAAPRPDQHRSWDHRCTAGPQTARLAFRQSVSTNSHRSLWTRALPPNHTRYPCCTGPDWRSDNPFEQISTLADGRWTRARTASQPPRAAPPPRTGASANPSPQRRSLISKKDAPPPGLYRTDLRSVGVEKLG